MEKIVDERALTPDNSTTIPNDFVDKYAKLFIDSEEKYNAVIDCIQQAYKAGLEIGRNESPIFAIIPMSILENAELSANAKLLYAEITALSKKSGKCYATNEHLGRVLGLSGRSIPPLIKELSGCGLVIVDIKRNKEGTYRNILVSYFNDGGHRSIARGGIVRERGQKRNRQSRNIQKENTSKTVVLQGNEVNELLFLFKEVNPGIDKYYGNKTQRGALERMLVVYGRTKLEEMIKSLPKVNAQKYWPKTTTPLQLEDNIPIYKAKNDELKINNKVVFHS